MPDLPRVVAESDVGSTAILEVWRKNKKINIEVILGELPGEVVTERKTIPNIESKLKIESLGITIEDHDNGVKVTSVEDVDISLINGDIITEVNREIVSNISAFEELVNSLEKTGRSSLLLKIIRDDEQNWVTIKFKNN
jgi:serine protease Do